MGRIWAISWFEIKRTFKKKESYFIMFGLPLIFTFIFGGLFSEGTPAKPTLALVDLDKSLPSKELSEILKLEESFLVIPESEQSAKERVDKGKIAGMITIKKGFSENLMNGKENILSLSQGPDTMGTASNIKQILNNAVLRVAFQTGAAIALTEYSGEEEWENSFIAIVNESEMNQNVAKFTIQRVRKSEVKSEATFLTQRAVGFSVMFLMISMLSSTGVILEARQSGVWQRILTTPAARYEIISGYLTAFYVIGWIQFGILMGATTVLFDLHWGNIIGQFVIVSSLLLFVIGLGLFIAGIVKTTEQQAALGTIIVVATCMLGGVYWPLDFVPAFLQNVAEFIPQTWAMRGFSELSVQGGDVSGIIKPVGVLLSYAAIFLGAGILRIRYE